VSTIDLMISADGLPRLAVIEAAAKEHVDIAGVGS
jgi:hypothetical protein